MHLGCELTSLTRFPPLSMALMTTRIRAFLFPIGIQLIPMKLEERFPMKLFRTYCTKGLMYLMSLVSALIFIAVLVQLVSISFWTITLFAALGSVIYLFTRSTS